MSKRLEKKPDIEAIIQRAVKEALAAGRAEAERAPGDAYRATERRLYALPTLVKKVEDARERLVELLQTGAPERSKDVARFTRTGVRLSASEILEALENDIKADIAADEHEITVIKKALENIDGDPYYPVVKGRYFKGISDEEIAKEIYCDIRTVRRHRSRLVQVLAIWFYGADAV